MNLLTAAFVLLAGYLIGSISFARIVTRLATGKDVTQFEIADLESGDQTHKANAIGGNIVSGQVGKSYGMLVAVLDILKVVLPMLAARALLPGPRYDLLVALAVMVGHIWPVYHGFRGGAGWSVAVGSLLVIDWIAVVACPLAGFVLGMLLRNVALAVASWLWLVIPWMWFRFHDWRLVAFAVALNVLFLLALIPQLRLIRRYAKEGKAVEFGRADLMSNPMGRGYLKIARFFGVEMK